MRNVILWQREIFMRLIRTMLLASALATMSFAAGVEESFAGVATPAGAAPAGVSGDQGSAVEQVWWRRGYYGWHRGYGWRGYGWRGYGYHPYAWGGGWDCWRWRFGVRVWVC
jgi:hypothetical protein